MAPAVKPSRQRSLLWPAGWAVLLTTLVLLVLVALKLLGSRSGQPDADTGTPVFTVYLLGGSTALGEPYAPKADLGQIVSWLWGGRFKGRPVRVVNLAGPGKPARAVVDDARQLSQERTEPGMAVALLYLGNNEFLRFDAHHDLRSAERTLFDQPTVDPAEKERVFTEYAASIEEIIEALQSAGIGVIASTVAVNMKDWEPNRSVLADATNGPAVERLLHEGDRKLESGQAEAALLDYREILRIEPTFALAWKKAGDCHRQSGRSDEARACYQKAIDEDGNPYRETSRQARSLREICARRRVPLVDAVAILEAASPDRLLGFELLWDNCHPTLEGYARIARGFAEAMGTMFGSTRSPAEVDVPALERFLGIDGEFKRRVIAVRGQYCYLSASLTWNPEARLARAGFYLKQALALKPQDADVLSSLAILEAVQGHVDGSIEFWRRAYRIDPQATLARARHPRVREILQRNGLERIPEMLEQ
jgi:tetratricopeptide (TPR) repeat protein